VLFNSRLFILVFLPVVLAGFFALSRFGRRAALQWLLVSSLVFYAWWKPQLLLLLLSIGANFWVGGVIARHRQNPLWLVSGVTFNLCLLGVFKYAGFLASLAGESVPLGSIYLPLGINFFTF
jgi:alginate O-acetyltransferase complex protein AlgI